MRSDGSRVKDSDPIHTLMPYFMNRRCDSTVMVALSIPLEPMRRFMREKRRENRAVSHIAVILSACTRTIREYPHFNRFIVNRKLYQHNDFTIAMVVLRPGAEDATTAKVKLDFNDTVFDTHRKLEECISASRRGDTQNEADKTANALLALPGFAFAGSRIIRLLDKYGFLPRAIIEASPFHSSIMVSNLASINTPRVYHHLYEVGTTSIFLTIGAEPMPPQTGSGASAHQRKLPITFTIDERICSGAYFAQCLNRLRFYLAKPSLLERVS